jgi:exodeoxyribonuclease VII small subunit
MEKEKPTYEEALAEIETIVEQIRNDEVSVEEIAGKVKRVGQLASFCRTRLTQADKEIAEALKNIEEDKGNEDPRTGA